ncbi:MAG: glycosyltransferase [Chitinispirillaceae bacterium]|nr:glycosyltransferase [Chitinispirillaceae bacterium]
MEKSPLIDIVIPTFNRLHIVTQAIRSVADQCNQGDNIFVVVQGQDRIFLDDKLKKLVKIIYLKRPNLPAARNSGISAGKNPLVLFIDDDCIAENGFLDAHRSSYTDETVGAVGGWVEDPIFGTNTQIEPSIFDIKTGKLIQNFSSPKERDTISVMGCNMSFRREALEKIGGFDIHFLNNALWEEIDASFRVILAGYRILFNPRAKVLHKREAKGGCRVNNYSLYLYHYFANTAYFGFTYAPFRYASSWLKFWFYHLEYFSRCKKVVFFKHNPLLVFAGISGMIGGMLRFMIYGKRRNILPYIEKITKRCN